MTPRCPRCEGPLWCDPRLGLLSHHRSGCPIGQAEDVRQVADFDAHQREERSLIAEGSVVTQRTVSDSERTLLVVAGVDERALLGGFVNVRWLTRSLRRRTFARVTEEPIVVSLLLPPSNPDDTPGWGVSP